MKIYKVGGCVRDKFLGKEPNDIDYVVVGSTIEEMISLGYKQVGKDFPVFLNENGDEYALARTERKCGSLHTDFLFDFNKNITIYDDLLRRDFTCNAIAEDIDTGEIIDPFNGRKDIGDGVLKLVNSETFKEDPLRVLRFCRFCAQLDFYPDDYTRVVCLSMVKDGMLNFITEERVWKEFEKALKTSNFEKFIKVMDCTATLEFLFPKIAKLKNVPEILSHHPEGNTYNHTLLTIKYADEHGYNEYEKFSLLLHDIGKYLTPKDVLPHHYGHEERGLSLIDEICRIYKVPNSYKDIAKMCCKYHMSIRRLYEMKTGSIYDIVCDVTKGFKDYSNMQLLLNVAKADLYGRGKQPREERVKQFDECSKIASEMFEILKNVSADMFPSLEKYKGKEFGEQLRVKKIQYYLDKRKPS